MGTKDHLDLKQLADTYEILGELAGREDARSFLGNVLEDRKPILVTVSSEPEGDEGNALSHLAADVNLLSGVRHRNLVPIIEARWLGTDALAVITERVALPSLEDQLSRRDEAFPYPRIATILQEVNAVLDWARGQKVVHRSVRLDSVFVDPGSDRVQVMFAVRSLPPTGIPGEQADAQTIAALARAMLTRSVADPERDKLALAELRPGLPKRVVEQTELLLQASPSAEQPDVRGYIASIAMADELKKGETETHRVIGEMTEEQRVTREALAAERKAHDEDLAEQARNFVREKEDAARALAKEKEDLFRAVEKEREEMASALAKEKDELTRAVAKERKELQGAIEKERAALTKERESLAKARAAFERSSAKSREQIDGKLAALQVKVAPPSTRRVGISWWNRAWANRAWRRGGIGAAALILLAMLAFAIGRDRDPGIEAPQLSGEVRLMDSMAGGVGAPLVAGDSTPEGPAMDTTLTPRPRSERSVRRPLSPVPSDSTGVSTISFFDSISGNDTTVSPLPFTGRDTVAATDGTRREGAYPDSLRRGSTPLRDTSALRRRDSVPSADSLPRPDSSSSGGRL